MPFSGDLLLRTKSEKSALHSEGADFCTLSHNFDTEVFVTEGELVPALWDCLSAFYSEKVEEQRVVKYTAACGTFKPRVRQGFNLECMLPVLHL